MKTLRWQLYLNIVFHLLISSNGASTGQVGTAGRAADIDAVICVEKSQNFNWRSSFQFSASFWCTWVNILEWQMAKTALWMSTPKLRIYSNSLRFRCLSSLATTMGSTVDSSNPDEAVQFWDDMFTAFDTKYWKHPLPIIELDADSDSRLRQWPSGQETGGTRGIGSASRSRRWIEYRLLYSTGRFYSIQTPILYMGRRWRARVGLLRWPAIAFTCRTVQRRKGATHYPYHLQHRRACCGERHVCVWSSIAHLWHTRSSPV